MIGLCIQWFSGQYSVFLFTPFIKFGWGSSRPIYWFEGTLVRTDTVAIGRWRFAPVGVEEVHDAAYNEDDSHPVQDEGPEEEQALVLQVACVVGIAWQEVTWADSPRVLEARSRGHKQEEQVQEASATVKSLSVEHGVNILCSENNHAGSRTPNLHQTDEEAEADDATEAHCDVGTNHGAISRDR